MLIGVLGGLIYFCYAGPLLVVVYLVALGRIGEVAVDVVPDSSHMYG